jgi:hypothetical protein
MTDPAAIPVARRARWSSAALLAPAAAALFGAATWWAAAAVPTTTAAPSTPAPRVPAAPAVAPGPRVFELAVGQHDRNSALAGELTRERGTATRLASRLARLPRQLRAVQAAPVTVGSGGGGYVPSGSGGGYSSSGGGGAAAPVVQAPVAAAPVQAAPAAPPVQATTGGSGAK